MPTQPACGKLAALHLSVNPVLPYELLVGLRYTRAKRRNHFISFISLASMIGIALGVMALIVVLSVMNGFQKDIRARILGVASHIQISGANERLANWQDVAAQDEGIAGTGHARASVSGSRS